MYVDPGHHSGVFQVDVHGSGQSGSLGDDDPGSEFRSSLSSLVFGLFSEQGSPSQDHQQPKSRIHGPSLVGYVGILLPGLCIRKNSC